MLQNPITIIHIISSLTRGGRERQLATIVANTDINQFPTKIVFLNKYLNSYIDEYGLEDNTIKVNSHGKLARLLELHHILKIEKPNIVYTWGNGESISMLLLKPFHSYILINGSVRHGILSRKGSHYLRTLVLHLCQNIVANSHAGLKANLLIKGFVLFNGIEPKFMVSLSKKEKKERRISKIGIELHQKLLISVANFVPYKDYFSVLHALKLLLDENYSFYYLILGDGPLKIPIQEKIKYYGLSKNVKILGNVENVQEYLQLADIFIHSSKGEGCSNAILEAMAASLPIIASDTGGTSEIVTKENGILFEYKNYKELKNSVRNLLNDISICVKMGEKSSQLIKNRFTVDVMMNNYYEIIRTISSK